VARRLHVRVVVLLSLALVPHAVLAQAPPARTVRDAAKSLLGTGFSDADIDAVATVVAMQIATFPIGTSSGGFTYRFNPATKSLELKKQSFGPLFAERASTLGSQGTFALAISAQSTRWESIEGQNLRNGDLRSRTALGNEFLDLNRFTFDVSTQTTVLSATLAADDDKDVGIIVPIVRTSLTGTRSSLSTTPPLRTEQIQDVAGTSLGDVVVRGKWNFVDRAHYGLTALLEVFLPTGSEEQLAGTGQFRLRPMFVASAEAGSFSPHVNVGFTVGGGGVRVNDNFPFLPVIEEAEPGHEFNYTLGADVTPAGPLTLFADLIGRSLRSVVRFDSGARLVDVPGLGFIPVESFIAHEGTLHTRLGAIGARTMVLGKGLISAAILFPLNEGGLKPGLTPVIGLEFTF